MYRSRLAIGLVVALLTLSALAISAPARAMPAPGPMVHPSASNVTVTTENYYGGTQTNFVLGQSTGRVYFSVSDVGGDTSATVQIHDHNATRDKVSNPAASWTVQFHGGTTNSSYLWSTYYLLPVTLTFGGIWNITVNGTKGGFAFQNFTVSTYFMTDAASPSVALPAHNASVFYATIKTVNQAPYTNVTNVELFALYYGAGGRLLKLPSTPVSLGSGALGWYNFTIPTDASGTVSFTLYANTTSNGGNAGNTSAAAYASIYVGHLARPIVTLGACPSACATSSFAAGAPVYVRVLAEITGSATGPAPGINATFKFERGASFVNPPGNPPDHVTTNANGGAAISFIASLSVFSATLTNSVSVTLTDPLEPSSGSVTTNATFTVVNRTTAPTLSVLFDSAQYYSGDTATVTWAVGGTNSTVTAGWYGSSWIVYRGSGTILSAGTIAHGTASGSFSVMVPKGYTGTLTAYVTISNETSFYSDSAGASVTSPTILLSPSEVSFLPGDMVTVGVATEGQILSGTTLWETVVDTSGNWISDAAVSGNQVTISVPNHGAPGGYVITVTAQSTIYGLVANATAVIYQAYGIDLSMWVSTPSSYTDGSFQPGQTVTLNYQFTPVGQAVLPKTYNITLMPYSAYSSGRDRSVVETASSSGSFSWVVPSDAKTGELLVQATARLGGPGCTSICYANSLFSVPINTAPPALGYEVGAGSGLTVAWLILFVIVVILAIGGFLLVRRYRGKTLLMKPEPSSGGSPPSPPTGGSS